MYFCGATKSCFWTPDDIGSSHSHAFLPTCHVHTPQIQLGATSTNMLTSMAEDPDPLTFYVHGLSFMFNQSERRGPYT